MPVEDVALAEGPYFFDHASHRDVVGPAPRFGAIAVDEQELVDAICRHGVGGLTKAQDVAIPRVEAGDGPASHGGDLVGDRHARDCCSSEMVVGHEETVGHWAQHADLMPSVHEGRARRRLDLADELERRHTEC